MPDPLYADARLAPIYDLFEPALRPDLDPYVAIADDANAERVVDLGCGTGCLALRLVADGRTVIGVDPAKASLDVARAKPDGERVSWVHGDAAAIPRDANADLVVMTGNAAQTVCTDEAWSATLRRVHAALRPGGLFVFETRRPERRGWEEWIDQAPETADVAGIGTVERTLDVPRIDLPLVVYRFTFRFPDGATVVSDSTVRFRDRDEIEISLRECGFGVRNCGEAPDRPGREFVFVAVRG